MASGAGDGQVGEVTVVLSGDWTPLQTALGQVNQALNQTGASFAVSGQAIDASLTAPLGRVAGAARDATGSLPSFYQGVEEGGVKAVGAERAVRRLESSLGAMALQSLGASGGLAGAASRVGEASLLFGYGSEAVLALGAGFAAFGLTLSLLNAPFKAITEDAAALTAQLDKVSAAGHPMVSVINELSAAQQKLQDAKDQGPSFLEQLFTTGLFAHANDVVDFLAKYSGLTTDLGLAGVTFDTGNPRETQRQQGVLSAQSTFNQLQAVLDRLHNQDLGKATERLGVSDIEVNADRGNLTGVEKTLKDRLGQLRNLNLGDAMTDALDKPLVDAFDKAFEQSMKEAAEKGDLGSLTALFERAKAGIQASGLPAGKAAEAIDALNKSFLELSKTLLQPVYQHELPALRVPTTFRPFTAPSGILGAPAAAPFQQRPDGLPPLNLPQINLPQTQLTSAVGIQPKVTQAMVDEGQRLTEAVQLSPHDIQGEVTALENLAKTHQHLQELLSAGVITQGTFDKAMQAAEDQAAHTNKTMIELSSSLSSAFTQIGQAIGNSLAGAAGGLQNFGALLFKIFGSLLSTVGQSLIAFGTAGIAIKSFISNPFLAIAAGAALIALGTALGATATASVNSAGSAIASGGGFSGGAPTVYSATGGAMPQPKASTTVVINSRGGILNLNDPDTMDELQGALEQLTDTRVTLQIGRSS